MDLHPGCVHSKLFSSRCEAISEVQEKGQGALTVYCYRFLGVDAFWACCMAWNVYLAFFHKYTARQLRTLDKWYLLGCYGASFVPAVTLAFVSTHKRGRVYGPAIVSFSSLTDMN